MESSVEVYEVFYREVLIGILQVDPVGNRYRYLPEKEGVAAVESRACLLRVMKEGQDWGEPIPFFQNRLYNMKRWKLRCVNYQTDNYTVRLRD